MVFDAGDDHAVVWTKPDDWEVDPQLNDANILNGHASGRDNGGTNVLLADGSVLFISNTIAPSTFRALVTFNGGEVINWEDIR